MNAGSVTFSTALDNEQLERDLAKLTKKIEVKERELADLKLKRDRTKEDSLFKAGVLDGEKEKLQAMKEKLEEIRLLSRDKSLGVPAREDYAAQLPALRRELEDQQTRVSALRSDFNKAAGAAERYEEKVSGAEELLSRQKEEAGYLVQQIDEAKKASGGMGDMIDTAGKRMDLFLDRVKKLASRVFIFTMITKALRALRDIIMRYIKTNAEARQAIAQLKGALLTLAQPLVEVVIPAFTLLVNILTQGIAAAARLVSSLFGKTLKQSKDGAKAMYKEAEAIGAVGEAADKAAGSLAGFDEINTISTENAKGAGGTAGGEIVPDFDFTPGKYKDMIDELMVYLSGALLVIGAILLFSGANIPLGLGLMVLGAAVLAQEIAENWGAVDGKINEAVKRVFMILGGALLVLGAILCFSGANIPLGIGLMVLGAAMLAASAALNWGSTGEELRNALSSLLQIIGPMIAIIGVILAVTGHLFLGIGLIIAGIALFEAGNAAQEDGDFVENIRARLTEALGIVGSLIAIVGLILLVTGNIILGLGLIIAGIALFEYSKVADDEGKTVQEKIVTVLKKAAEAVGPLIAVVGLILLLVPGHFLTGLALLVAGIALFAYTKVSDDGGKAVEGKIAAVLKETAKIAGAFLLVLGLILLFIPPMWPTAIALIAAGVVGLVTAKALDSDAIKNKLAEMWQGIKNWWGQNVKKYLTADWWKGKGQEVIDGLLGGLKDAWSGLTSWFSGVWDDLFGNRKVSVGVSATSSAGNYNSGSRTAARSIPEIAPQSIPALAQGAVIPPNREFLAVLGDQRSGTNVEAPEGLLRQLFREELGETAALLQAILEAVRDGHVILVDGTVFGRTAIKTINSVNTAAGKQLLIL